MLRKSVWIACSVFLSVMVNPLPIGAQDSPVKDTPAPGSDASGGTEVVDTDTEVRADVDAASETPVGSASPDTDAEVSEEIPDTDAAASEADDSPDDAERLGDTEENSVQAGSDEMGLAADEEMDVGLEGEGMDDMLGLDLEQLLETPIEVWTATKTKSTLAEAPAVMTVISKEEIQLFGYQSVAEVLQQVVGFYIIDDHMIPNLGIRGIDGGFMGESGSVKVLINGQNMVARSTGGNWLGAELIPLTAIERIEVIRGPASALYGADAFLGVVNIITISGEDAALGTMQGGMNITAESKLGHDLDFTLGGRRGGLEILASGRFYEADRSGLELPDSSPNPSIPVYQSDNPKASHLIMKSQVGHLEMTYHFNEKHRLKLFGHIAGLERGGEFSPWSQMSYGSDDSGRRRGTHISLYESKVGAHLSLTPHEKLSLDWQVAYSRGEPRDNDVIDVGSDLFYVRRDFGHDTFETSLEGRWHILEDLTTVLGAEFIYDWENLPSSLKVLRFSMNDRNAGEVMTSSSSRQDETELYNIGAFVQAMYSGLKPWLDLTGGFRYDNHNLYGNQISGRFGAISSPVKMLHIKLLYGSAFKAPSPLLLYGVPHQVGDIYGNPDLKPQKVHTIEGEIRATPVKYISLSTALAYNMLIDKAEFVQQGINRVAMNLSQVNSISSESEIVAKYNEWVQASVAFEYQWTTREFEKHRSAYYDYLIGDQNVVYPNFILRTGLSGQVPKVPLRAGVRLNYVGERPSSEMNALENLAMYKLSPYLMLNATISTVGLKFVGDRETTFSIVGRNLTDKRAADPGFAGIDYPLACRTIFFVVRQQL